MENLVKILTKKIFHHMNLKKILKIYQIEKLTIIK